MPVDLRKFKELCETYDDGVAADGTSCLNYSKCEELSEMGLELVNVIGDLKIKKNRLLKYLTAHAIVPNSFEDRLVGLVLEQASEIESLCERVAKLETQFMHSNTMKIGDN